MIPVDGIVRVPADPMVELSDADTQEFHQSQHTERRQLRDADVRGSLDQSHCDLLAHFGAAEPGRQASRCMPNLVDASRHCCSAPYD